MDITSAEELEKALSQIGIAGKHGIIPIKDMAKLLPQILAASKKSGITANIGESSGMLQLSRQYAKDDAKAGNMVQRVYSSITRSEAKLNKAGVKTTDRNISEIIADLMTTTDGDRAALTALVGGNNTQNYMPYMDKYNEIKKQGLSTEETNKKFIEYMNSFGDSVKAVTQINKDAAEMNNTASSKYQIAINAMRAELENIDYQPIIDAIGPLSKALVELSKVVVDVADFMTKVTGKEDVNKAKKYTADYTEAKQTLAEKIASGASAEEIQIAQDQVDFHQKHMDQSVGNISNYEDSMENKIIEGFLPGLIDALTLGHGGKIYDGVITNDRRNERNKVYAGYDQALTDNPKIDNKAIENRNNAEKNVNTELNKTQTNLRNFNKQLEKALPTTE
jgi:DNA repair exonuclease SbcCD ATPase subunit